MIRKLQAAILLISFYVFVAFAQSLHAGTNLLESNGTRYELVRTAIIGSYIQSEYFHNNGDGSSSGTYCFYRHSDYALSHYPNTPLPVDSNPNCPDPLPLASEAGRYLIKTSSVKPGKCVTVGGGANGAPVVIADCDYRHGNPSQKWTFDGSLLKQDNLCLDVTDGSNTNGVKLQVWACDGGNKNQKFTHAGGDVVTFPDERIGWLSSNKCLDLTDGNDANGNQLQLWTCDPGNSNQHWFLEIGF